MNKLLKFVLGLSLSPLVMATTITDDTPVTLQGTVKMMKFSSPTGGKIITTPVLKLRTPINYNDMEMGVSKKNVSEVQSYMDYDSKQKLPKSGCIVASGELFAAHTAHHYTPVVFTIKSFESCK